MEDRMFRFLLITGLLISGKAFSEVSLGAFYGTVSTDQQHINNLMDNANTRTSGVGVKNIDSSNEISAYFQYRVDKSIWAFQFRPSYLFKSTDGSGGSGSLDGKYEYDVSAVIFAGLVKVYALESKYLRLYFLAGLNYGNMFTTIKEADFKVEASGSNLGFQFGTGLEVTLGSHGILLEAGVRKLSIDRNIVDSTSGTAESDSASQYGKGEELEFGGKDLGTTLSGVQIQIGYAYYF